MGPHKSTPLYAAASKGHVAIVKILLAHGADANATDWSGDTPLRRAVKNGYLDIVKSLVEYGANVHGKDKLGRTLLHSVVMVRGERTVIVKTLVIEYGVDINIRDDEGFTPLQKATAFGHSNIVKFLLERGADANREADEGSTPSKDVPEVNKRKREEAEEDDSGENKNDNPGRSAVRPRFDKDVWVKHQEHQYLDLVRHIIDRGQQCPDRTETGTRSLFAPNQLRFDLSDDVFPLITTKHVSFSRRR